MMESEAEGEIERVTTLLPAVRTAFAAVSVAATKEEARLAVRRERAAEDEEESLRGRERRGGAGDCVLWVWKSRERERESEREKERDE
jgi:hypothetical protein